MKFLSTQISDLLSQQQTRRNLKALLKYVAFLLAVVQIYALLFCWIMAAFENEEHSFVAGIYWALTVMSTLGFGDITFHSDIGRLFSITERDRDTKTREYLYEPSRGCPARAEQ